MATHWPLGYFDLPQVRTKHGKQAGLLTGAFISHSCATVCRFIEGESEA